MIKVEIFKDKTEVVLAVTDNGKGMEQNQVDRLFEAFYTSKISGMGVGLNSVKTILDEHEARIEVISQPNKGSTFKIFFTSV